MIIPFVSFKHMHNPIKAEMMKAFEEFYDTNWYVLGERVNQFEHAYSFFNQVKYTIGVSNGLDAIFIALKTLGIGDGDEVLVPSNTYIATWLAVSYIGATPIPVEPDLVSYNINPKLIEASITNKTKAIIPVHLYGQCCQMNEIMNIANKYNLFVIEDNAQAQGASFQNQLSGSFGHINATSFYPGKNLGALGDAGAVTTNNEELAKKANVLRNYGSEKKYFNEVIGFNMRLDECQAAFLSIKLKHLLKWNEERRQIAEYYNRELFGINDLTLPSVLEEATHVYHLYVIRTKNRNELQNYLTNHGIATMIHYPIPPHLQEAYKNLGYKKGDFPIAEEIADTCLSLPIWPGLKENDIQFICNHIKTYFKSN
jgi:dTDP-4-amino-4,6-dideoxygalactose transaminase